MTRLNILLFVAIIALSVGVITAQHIARKHYFDLEQLQETSKKLGTEYEQLQLEQSTWAMHSRLEDLAAQELKMKVPEDKRIQVIVLDEKVQ